MRPARDDAGIDWGLIFGACERRLRMRKWDVGRYTLSQILNALRDPNAKQDPHAGGIPVMSAEHFERLLEELD